MKLLDAEWTPQVNLLVVQCECGRIFKTRVDRWTVVCPKCRKKERIEGIREQQLPGGLIE